MIWVILSELIGIILKLLLGRLPEKWSILSNSTQMQLWDMKIRWNCGTELVYCVSEPNRLVGYYSAVQCLSMSRTLGTNPVGSLLCSGLTSSLWGESLLNSFYHHALPAVFSYHSSMCVNDFLTILGKRPMRNIHFIEKRHQFCIQTIIQGRILKLDQAAILSQSAAQWWQKVL